MKLPETMLEFREWQESGRLRDIRLGCGISRRAIAGAVGVSPFTVYRWEEGHHVPASSVMQERYTRVIRGMMNHLEVSREL